MSKLKAERDDERDSFSKEAMDKALGKLKVKGLRYYRELKKRKTWKHLKCHYTCLCQGAALYYAHLLDRKTNPAYRGVKDFDVWLFVSKGNKTYASRKPKKENIRVQGKCKKVDLLIYCSRHIKTSSGLIKALQKDCRRKTARCLLDKAIIELSPDKKILYVNKEYSDKNKKC